LIIFSKALTRLFLVFAFIVSTHAYLLSRSITVKTYLYPLLCWLNDNLVPRAFPFLSLGRREKALAPGGLLCILIGQWQRHYYANNAI
jgi:hypothetical protein